MARDPETIEREIEKARDQLAESLDALTDRAHPRHLVESGKQRVQAQLETPAVRYVLIGVGAILALAVLRKLFR
ncbi:MAG: DUF3618 domain-containing protein [Pseudonocardia sp.]